MSRDLDPTKYKIERYNHQDRYFRWVKGCYKYGVFVNLFQNGYYSSHWQELNSKIHHRIIVEIKSHPEVKVIDFRTPKPTEKPSLKQKLLGILGPLPHYGAWACHIHHAHHTRYLCCMALR